MSKIIKVILLTNNQILISEIEEVGADVDDSPLVAEYENNYTLSPFLLKLSRQDEFMMSSDKILTLADPMPTLLEKYEEMTKE